MTDSCFLREAWQGLDRTAVERLLAQRPPFLFVDCAEIHVGQGQVRTWYQFRADEPFFEGHFPGDPIVPGVILIEAMAQAGRLILRAAAPRNGRGYLVGIDAARFLQVARPLDALRVQARLVRSTGDVGTESGTTELHELRCAAYLGDRCAARAHLTLYRSSPVENAPDAPSTPDTPSLLPTPSPS